MAVIAGTTKADKKLLGTAIDDTLDGGKGADSMAGLAGNDIYVVDNAKDLVIEELNSGTDTVQSSVSYTLGANVENLTLTGKAKANGTGNDLDNVIVGNTGNNILSGGTGNDALSGGTGSDTFKGGAGADTLDGGLDKARDVFVYSDLSTSDATGGIDHLLNFNTAYDKIDIDAVHLRAAIHTVAGASGKKTYVDDTKSITINSAVTTVDTVDQLYQAIEASSINPKANGAAFVNVLGNSALAGRYVLINDAVAAVDGHDALIGISGSGTLSGQVFM